MGAPAEDTPPIIQGMEPTKAGPDPGDRLPLEPLRWDLFCRVIDNFGDLGVCRRLALNLAALGQSVRLWVDDVPLMRRMAGDWPAWDESLARRPAAGVSWLAWDRAENLEPGDVVVEAFGCNPPSPFIVRMSRQAMRPAVWVNLEYLSAEDYVKRSHGLESPQADGPGKGLRKWFYFPGFEPGTGGLLREPGLLQRRRTFDRGQWLAGLGLAVAGERLVSIFGYPQAPLENLLNSLAACGGPATRVLVAQGALQERALHWQAQHPNTMVRVTPLPWLHPDDFDRLLWSADLNFVRGEDSLVRALWADQAFIWQAYAQTDDAHGPKVQAFWDRVLCPPRDAEWTRELKPWWLAWNALAPWPNRLAFDWAMVPPWRGAVTAASARLSQGSDLAHRLLSFVASKRPAR